MHGKGFGSGSVDQAKMHAVVYESVIVGPTLRGATTSRTLQEGPLFVQLLVVGGNGEDKSKCVRDLEEKDIIVILSTQLVGTSFMVECCPEGDFFPGPPCSCKPVVCVANIFGGQLDWRRCLLFNVFSHHFTHESQSIGMPTTILVVKEHIFCVFSFLKFL